jgi:N-acyl-D-aspartate/D-glutamate deacylase
MHGRTGGDFASWKTKKGFPDSLVIRDGSMLIFDGAPVSEWDGESMADVMTRVQRYQGGDSATARSDAEREAFDLFPKVLRDDADFMLHMMRTYDKSFRFYADIANKDNTATLGFLLDEQALPGFNDSGAHITNMAFFDSNLMSLKLAKERDEATVAHMVKRLTSEPAEIFGLDVGSLDIGAQADMVLINPDALDGWQPDQTRKLEYREIFGHEQMVNRPEGIVDSVFINGVVAWKDGMAQSALGQETLGRALRAA